MIVFLSGYYHSYVAHLIKALEDEAAVPGLNGLVSVHIPWVVCLSALQKCADVLSRQGRNLLKLPHEIKSVDLFGFWFLFFFFLNILYQFHPF